jgi:hypothetical protein
MSNIRLSLPIVVLLATNMAYATCNATAETDPGGYKQASNRVAKLAEFKAWYDHVKARPQVKAIFGSHVDKQSTLNRKCYWSVTVYSDEGTHLSRWQTFFVPVANGAMLIEDLTTGEPVPLRSNSTIERDASKSSTRGSP